MTRGRFYIASLAIGATSAVLIGALPAVVPEPGPPIGAAYDRAVARTDELAGLAEPVFEATWATVLFLESAARAESASRGLVRLGDVRPATDEGGAPRASGVTAVLDAPSSAYPPTLYCPQCREQRCWFEDDGLVELASTVSPDAVRSLAVAARGAGVSLAITFVGGADSGAIARKTSERSCDAGGATRWVSRRTRYHQYAGQCGAETLRCESVRGGDVVELGESVSVSTNPVLACLRARCLYAASDLYRTDELGVTLALRSDVGLGSDAEDRTSRVLLELVLPDGSVPGSPLHERVSRALERRLADGAS